MPLSDLTISTLFLVFLILFVLLGNSPALHRWLDRVTGMGEKRDEAVAEEEPGVASGEPSARTGDYEAIVFQQLALADPGGLSAGKLAGALHFDRTLVVDALSGLEDRGMIRAGAGLIGRRYHLTDKGRGRAVQEGIIPRLRSGSGG